MKVAILGAGATGGFLGARLAKAGAEVVLIARGAHLRAMTESGLRLIEPDGVSTVRVNATDDLGVLRSVDAVFVTLKAHSLPAIAERLAANLGAGTAVVSAQNGIPWWYFQSEGGLLDRLTAHAGRKLDDDVALLLLEIAPVPAGTEQRPAAAATPARPHCCPRETA